MRSIASAIRVDTDNGNWEQRERCIRVYGPFFHYLRYSKKSPLEASLAKISQKPERWMQVLMWPFGFEHDFTLQLAEEAKTIAATLNSQAKAEVRQAFDKKIEESLDEGGGWLHKFVKNDKQESRYSSITRVNGVAIGKSMTTKLFCTFKVP